MAGQLLILVPKLFSWLETCGSNIECEGWRRHSILIFLILLFTKPNIEVSGCLYQTKTHFTHIVYQPFSRVLTSSFTLYDTPKNVSSKKKFFKTCPTIWNLLQKIFWWVQLAILMQKSHINKWSLFGIVRGHFNLTPITILII